MRYIIGDLKLTQFVTKLVNRLGVSNSMLDFSYRENGHQDLRITQCSDDQIEATQLFISMNEWADITLIWSRKKTVAKANV